jgi:hypothetical protein
MKPLIHPKKKKKIDKKLPGEKPTQHKGKYRKVCELLLLQMQMLL